MEIFLLASLRPLRALPRLAFWLLEVAAFLANFGLLDVVGVVPFDCVGYGYAIEHTDDQRRNIVLWKVPVRDHFVFSILCSLTPRMADEPPMLSLFRNVVCTCTSYYVKCSCLAQNPRPACQLVSRISISVVVCGCYNFRRSGSFFVGPYIFSS